ncbi:hypothetical protein pA_gene0030 [Vibrio phage 13VT501A]|nr:hypothetical protein pA_gene0030 [Vibrio phage 13VT501A]
MSNSEKDLFILRQQLPLEQKIQMSVTRLIDWIEYWENYDEQNDNAPDHPVYLAVSGGKDSHVVGDLVYRFLPKKYHNRILMVFSNTGLEMPEIVKHVRDELISNQGWPIVQIRPKRTYQEVWKEEGIPLVSKKVARQIRTLKAGPTGGGFTYRLYDEGINKNGQSAPRWKLAKKWRHLIDNPNIKTTEKCCDALKKDPIKDFEKEYGMKGRSITGMMASEGGYRSGMTKCNVFDGKTTRSSPILFWTESDIWEYVNKYNVKICEVYYRRAFDDSGNCVASDWPYSDLPTFDEFRRSKPMLNQIKGDAKANEHYGTYAVFEDWSDSKKKYTMIHGEHRTGCMFCAFGAHLEKGANRFQKMSVSHPRQHSIVMDRIGMREPLELINVKVTFD